ALTVTHGTGEARGDRLHPLVGGARLRRPHRPDRQQPGGDHAEDDPARPSFERSTPTTSTHDDACCRSRCTSADRPSAVTVLMMCSTTSPVGEMIQVSGTFETP